MKKLTDFMSEIDEKELEQIVEDYKVFRKQGYIGESMLRNKAEMINKDFGIFCNITAVMVDLAFYANSYFANKYLSLIRDKNG